jgi:hypothetical protein
MLADGRADALMAHDLDRAFRDPRDLEDMIGIVASPGTWRRVPDVAGSPLCQAVVRHPPLQ